MFRRKRPGNGQPYLRPSRHTVDAGVLPLVSALNCVEGITTRASCEGHWPLWLPYVSFRTAEPFAEWLDRLVTDSPSLNFPWTVEAHFGTDRHLWFSLNARVLDGWGTWLPGLSLLFPLRIRSKINADFQLLACTIKEANAAGRQDQ